MKKQKTMKTQRERENLEQLKKQKKMDRERERERDLSFLVCCLLCAYTTTRENKRAKPNARNKHNAQQKRARKRTKKRAQKARDKNTLRQKHRQQARPQRQYKHGQKFCTLLDLCVSSLRRGHANLLCIVPILTDDPRRESSCKGDARGPQRGDGGMLLSAPATIAA